MDEASTEKLNVLFPDENGLGAAAGEMLRALAGSGGRRRSHFHRRCRASLRSALRAGRVLRTTANGSSFAASVCSRQRVFGRRQETVVGGRIQLFGSGGGRGGSIRPSRRGRLESPGVIFRMFSVEKQ